MIDLIGNSSIRKLIEDIALEKPLGLSWIFQGPKGVGKALFAKQWALKRLQGASGGLSQLSTHPDLHLIKPQGKQALHTMEALKQMSREVHLPPTLSSFKVFIIEDAECLPIICANYLLKTLEEPPADALFILTTCAPEKLPRTIHSRCRTFFFHALSIDEIGAWLEGRGFGGSKTAERSNGSLARAERLSQESSDERSTYLMQALKRLQELSLSEIIEISDYLQRSVQSLSKERHEKLEAKLSEQKERFSAAQMEMHRGEIEGETALLEKDLIHELFEEIVLYFRDLWALKMGATALHYMSLQAPEESPYSFIAVENLLMEAKEQLIYGTALSLVLQRFFLKLRSLN